MNDFIRNNISKILKIFLYLQPIIDIITALTINLNISFGLIIRTIFLLFIIYYYIFINKDKNNLKYLIIILIYVILYSINIFIIKDINALFYDFKEMFKIIYLTILVLLLKKEHVKINYKDLVKISLIYMLFIIIPDIFKISNQSYTQGKIGSIGLFNSTNEISAILSILTPFIIYYLFQNNKIIYKIIIGIVLLYTYFIIGSKIIIIALILSIIYNLYLYFKTNNINKRNILIIISIIVLLFIIGIILLPHTSFYYNIKLHLNFLGINSINDIFSYNFINRFIFSDRLDYLINTHNIFMNSNIFSKIFGLGFIMNFATDIETIKVIEMDLFDIFYHLGIIGFIITLFPLFKKYYNYFKNNNNKLIKFSLILSILISILVGHTLVAPAVSIYLVYLLNIETIT